MSHIFIISGLYRKQRLFFFLFILLLTVPCVTYSQTNQQKNITTDPYSHHEFKDDDYIPDLRGSQARSPAYNYFMNGITTTQVNVDANGQNIVGDAANEPSIAIDRNDPNRMTIGWRQFNTVSSNFRQAGFGYTINGGQSWTFPGVIEPGVFRSDPVLDNDVYGNFYYNSLLGSPFSCQVFKSTTGGSSWGSGVDARGGDKQWMTVDKTSGAGNGHIYSYWTTFYSSCMPGSFTRSANGGLFFEDCVTIPQQPYWGTMAVGPDGELYIGGAISWTFVVAKSTNAKDSSQIVSWQTTSIVDLDGDISSGVGPNPGGLLGQTMIAVDTSYGPFHGNVYLLCSSERHSNSDPLDVMFALSTNGGASWSSPIKINDDTDTSAYQWFGTMSVAPNGRIDVIWLDTRDNPGTVLSALYYSNSSDGGTSWLPNRRLSDYFDPHVGWPNQNKMGDYFDMESANNGVHLAWAATFNGEQDVYYSFITDTSIVPVELTSFTAISDGKEIILNWSTLTELNNHGFEIQRSLNGKEFYTIGFIIGHGTTTEQHNYTYTQKILENGKYYYRLKQVDYNGSFEYSNVVEADFRAFNAYLLEQNYPNPFNPRTSIGFGIQNKSKVKITLLNSLGEEVAVLLNDDKEAGYHTIEFNAAGLPSGIYFYQSRAGEFVQTKKMLLLK